MTQDATVEKRVRIVNRKGLHARASAKLAKLASSFPADIFVIRNGDVANAISIMDLLMLAAHQGSEVDVKAKGPKAETALDAIVALIEDGFGERDEDD